MRIVLAAGYAPSLIGFRGPLLEGMVKAGHEVWAMAPEDDPDVAAALKAMNVRYRQTLFQRTSMNPMADVRGMRHLADALREIKPDLILSYPLRMAIWANLAAVKAGVPSRFVMVTGMGTAFTASGIKGKAMAALARSLMKRSFKGAERVIVQNPDDAREIVEMGVIPQKKIAVVNGSGVDLSLYPLQEWPRGPIKVLMIGRLLKEKGIREFAEAAALVRAARPDVEFHLLGQQETGHTSAISDAEMELWQKEGRLVWHGQQNVLPYLKEASLYVLPSYREGTPRSVLEALAVGRPVITTDVPGCRETIVDGVEGRLVPAKDAKALAQAILESLESPEKLRQMGAAARARAEAKYDVRLVNRQMMELMGLTPADG